LEDGSWVGVQACNRNAVRKIKECQECLKLESLEETLKGLLGTNYTDRNNTKEDK